MTLPEIEIRTSPRQDTAVIRVQVAPGELGSVIGPAITEIWEEANRQGIEPSMAWFDRYFSLGEDEWDFEIGAPVPRPIEPAGRVKPSELPACEAAVARHVGPYERLAETHALMQQWLTERGRESSGPFWEVYLTGPESEPDPEKWVTELVRPLAARGE